MGEITPLLVTIHNSEADNPTNQHQPALININQPRFPTSPSLSHINFISFPIILQNWCFIYHVTCPSISEQNPQLFPWEKGSTCDLRGKLLELPGNTVAGAQENIGRTYDVAPGLMGCRGRAGPEEKWGTNYELISEKRGDVRKQFLND